MKKLIVSIILILAVCSVNAMGTHVWSGEWCNGKFFLWKIGKTYLFAGQGMGQHNAIHNKKKNNYTFETKEEKAKIVFVTKNKFKLFFQNKISKNKGIMYCKRDS